MGEAALCPEFLQIRHKGLSTECFVWSSRRHSQTLKEQLFSKCRPMISWNAIHRGFGKRWTARPLDCWDKVCSESLKCQVLYQNKHQFVSVPSLYSDCSVKQVWDICSTPAANIQLVLFRGRYFLFSAKPVRKIKSNRQKISLSFRIK